MDEALGSGAASTVRDGKNKSSAVFAGVVLCDAARVCVPLSFLAWFVLGLISGFIASEIVNKSGSGIVMDIVLGIVGAVVGAGSSTPLAMLV